MYSLRVVLVIPHRCQKTVTKTFSSRYDRLRSCVDLLSDERSTIAWLSDERRRTLAIVLNASAGLDPDATLARIAALCAEWGITVEFSTDESPYTPVDRLYAVVTEHDDETDVELFADPEERRASLLERIGNARASDEPIPARFAENDERLALLLTALLLPDEVRLAESVRDPENRFYRPVPSRG